MGFFPSKYAGVPRRQGLHGSGALLDPNWIHDRDWRDRCRCQRSNTRDGRQDVVDEDRHMAEQPGEGERVLHVDTITMQIEQRRLAWQRLFDRATAMSSATVPDFRRLGKDMPISFNDIRHRVAARGDIE